MIYCLDNFPVAPTSNHLYFTARNNRRVKSKEYKQFLDDVRYWHFCRLKECVEISQYFQNNLEGNWIEISLFICLTDNKLYTQKGAIKKMDASNRIKATHDALSEVLEIDDKYFSIGLTQKVLSTENKSLIFLRTAKINLEKEIRGGYGQSEILHIK